ncbi:MAG TPA: lipid-transfer protein, partial [Acidimicrobiales bacterium]|nr:lipid-transfer protein [Acidimicrobiales bacterium]
ARSNPFAQLSGDPDIKELLAEPYMTDPLRRHDCPPISDGACAVVLVAGDRARSASNTPVWIKGIDHRVEPHALGVRDLTKSVSTTEAGKRAGVGSGPIDVAELYAPFSHQQLILSEALGLGDEVSVNPSGGALCANVIMSAGLTRIGEAANRIASGEARRAIAHATAGPCLQQNLVCVLEGDS